MNSQELKSKIEKYNLMALSGVDGVFYFDLQQFAASEDAPEENKRKFRTIGATNTPTSDGRQIDHETSLPNFSEDAEADGGVPIMINHDSYGGAESLPIGRTYSGEYNAKLRQFLAKFWIDDLEAVEQGQRVIAGIDSGGGASRMCRLGVEANSIAVSAVSEWAGLDVPTGIIRS